MKPLLFTLAILVLFALEPGGGGSSHFIHASGMGRGCQSSSIGILPERALSPSPNVG